jgi:hypothetical protein
MEMLLIYFDVNFNVKCRFLFTIKRPWVFEVQALGLQAVNMTEHTYKTGLHANPLARSPRQVKLDSDK